MSGYLRRHVESFKNVNVTVFGDLMLDEYVQGDALRLSPEAPVPVILAKDIRYSLGGAGNVAANITSLGGSAVLAGILGNDAEGDIFQRRAAQHGISVQTYGTSTMTTRKVRIQGQRDHPFLRLDYEQSPGADTPSQQNLLTLITRDTQVVVISDYAKGAVSLPACRQIIDLCNKLCIPCLIDPKPGSFAVQGYAGCFLLKPNRLEAEQLVGYRLDSERTLNRAGEELTVAFSCNVLITLGSEGMRLFKRDGTHCHFVNPVVQVSDVTGAGDTVSATLALALGSGLPLEEACKLASTAARICVSKPGTVAVQADELLRALRGQDDTRKIYLVEEPLLTRLQESPTPLRVVMANGCFDVFHAGHVDLLTQAKARGDFLIVALNSDESVRQLKGTTRPINPWEQRADVLAALSVVDAVIIFHETSPAQLFERFKPNVVVHGEDGMATGALERAAVEKHGGQTVYIKRTLDISSSQILKLIQA